MSFLINAVSAISGLGSSDIRSKVLEATGDEKWGPTGKQMQELAQASQSYEHFPRIMETLWDRMAPDSTKNWRWIYKSLVLLEYLVRCGSEDVVMEARMKGSKLQQLNDFYRLDTDGKDVGLNVRQKSKSLVELLRDGDRLHAEREKARVTASKFEQAISSEDSRARNFSNSYSNNSSHSSSYPSSSHPSSSSSYSSSSYSSPSPSAGKGFGDPTYRPGVPAQQPPTAELSDGEEEEEEEEVEWERKEVVAAVAVVPKEAVPTFIDESKSMENDLLSGFEEPPQQQQRQQQLQQQQLQQQQLQQQQLQQQQLQQQQLQQQQLQQQQLQQQQLQQQQLQQQQRQQQLQQQQFQQQQFQQQQFQQQQFQQQQFQQQQQQQQYQQQNMRNNGGFTTAATPPAATNPKADQWANFSTTSTPTTTTTQQKPLGTNELWGRSDLISLDLRTDPQKKKVEMKQEPEKPKISMNQQRMGMGGGQGWSGFQ